MVPGRAICPRFRSDATPPSSVPEPSAQEAASVERSIRVMAFLQKLHEKIGKT